MGKSFSYSDVIYLAKGALVTIELFILSACFGMIIGFVFGIMRSNHRVAVIRWIAATYIEIFRATPLLVMILIIFFGLPFIGIDINRFWAAVTALTLYASAYLGEIFRAGIQSIRKEQWEAGASLGMNYRKIIRYVIFPQTIKVITPSIIGFFMGLIKGTALVSVIGALDLMLAARRVAQRTFLPLLVMGIAAMMYFAICFPLDRLGSRIEQNREKPL